MGGKALIKIRKDNSTVWESPNALVYIFKFEGKKRKGTEPNSVVPGVNLSSFSYKELEQATNGFKEELGTGA
uniref:Uncharacterized protein n=1 Tax=Solanum lycopersicum TaxID=4081 RepID=A0A3Q7EB91_SOLLC